MHGHSAGSYTGAWIAGHVTRIHGLALQVAQLSALNFPAQVLEPLLQANVHLLHLTGDQLSRFGKPACQWLQSCISQWRKDKQAAPTRWPAKWRMAILSTTRDSEVVAGRHLHGYGHLLGLVEALSHFDSLDEAGIHHPLLRPQEQGATAFAFFLHG